MHWEKVKILTKILELRNRKEGVLGETTTLPFLSISLDAAFGRSSYNFESPAHISVISGRESLIQGWQREGDTIKILMSHFYYLSRLYLQHGARSSGANTWHRRGLADVSFPHPVDKRMDEASESSRCCCTLKFYATKLRTDGSADNVCFMLRHNTLGCYKLTN